MNGRLIFLLITSHFISQENSQPLLLALQRRFLYTATMDLFTDTAVSHEPLAARMRPRNLEEFIGQDHIAGHGRLLWRMIKADQLSSLIFYGPPGTGKTTIAQVIANTTKSAFITMNAVLSGVKQLREAIAEAKDHRELYDRRTILFIDEVHRWNKAQQDALLPWVENGTVILIGATTENPFFEVNPALVSRSRIFQLKPLTEEDLQMVAQAALTDLSRGYGRYKVTFDDGALEHLIQVASGDARSLLNALELAIETTPDSFPPEKGEMIHITLQTAEESIQRRVVLYDKEGDYHFDTISAFIKSLRGSDPDAALYWLAKMVRAGEDPRFIFRRMLIASCEDIGLADPQAIGVVEASAAAFDRVGLPEGRFHLTHAALYLATAPKSNSSLGFFDALAAVEREAAAEVPNHLKDAGRDKEGFGHGEGYLYPHAYRDHWVNQQYLPDSLQGKVFYQPSEQGYEEKIRTEVLRRREARIEASFEQTSREILTFTPGKSLRDRWMDRVNRGIPHLLETIRQRIFDGNPIQRHDRIYVVNSKSGFLIWEAVRRAPEGGVWAFCPLKQSRELVDNRSKELSGELRPVLLPKEIIESGKEGWSAASSGPVPFDVVIGRNIFRDLKDRETWTRELFKTMAKGGRISFAEVIPRKGQRLSKLPGLNIPVELEADFLKAEETIYSDSTLTKKNVKKDPDSPLHLSPLMSWDETDLADSLGTAGFTHVSTELEEFREKRWISEKTIDRWFSGTYGTILEKRMGEKAAKAIQNALVRDIEGKELPWTRVVAFLTAEK